MRQLHIDIETYSSFDIRLGVYKYVEAPDFEILLFAYAFDDEPVELIEVACGEDLPQEVVEALMDKRVRKIAHNAQFERICIQKYYKMPLDVDQWWCTMVHAAQLGLPGKLGDVAKVLSLEEQKDTAGTLLINYFSKPCKPTQRNNGRTRNYPYHDMDKWELFGKYCKQDVETERAIGKYLEQFPSRKNEIAIYHEDQRINDYGILVDMDLVSAVRDFNEDYSTELIQQSKALTGLENANSRAQLLEWMQGQGLDIQDIRKETLGSLLKVDIPDHVRLVIENRQETGKAAVKKYDAVYESVCTDQRVHGTLRYYGASRTGRWSGRILQPQNLYRNSYKEIDALRILVKRRDYETLQAFYPSMTEVFSQLIRTVITAPEGKTLAIADYSAIEARVIAWLAQEKWVMDVFAQDGDVYKQTAAQMFNLSVEEIDKPLRQKGKIAVLALGYQGGVNSMISMGALKMGIKEGELLGIVQAWRRANPHIVKLWKDIQDRVVRAIKSKEPVEFRYGIRFSCEDEYLFITLPSGRRLAYYGPQIIEGEKGINIRYQGIESGRKVWGWNATYGGKLTENIVQAIARDCLAEALMKVSAAGYHIVTHIHDELVVEVPEEDSETHLNLIRKLMGSRLNWAPGLYLSAAGYTSKYYLKD